jgi:hypothetical protein
MSKYPDWLDRFREPGTAVRKIGNSYYLYKVTSVRVPGKKNPQPKGEYIGVITPEGVVKTNVRKLQTDVVRVYEYGFSYAMRQLTPPKFTSDIGDAPKAESLFLHIVKKYSPTSYLLRGVDLPPAEELHVCLSTQIKKYERLSGARIESLMPLCRLYLVEMGGREMLSEITPEIEELLTGLGVSL